MTLPECPKCHSGADWFAGGVCHKCGYRGKPLSIQICDKKVKTPTISESKYDELIMAVERKHPNETRHETALRYIKETELRSSETGQEKTNKPWMVNVNP